MNQCQCITCLKQERSRYRRDIINGVAVWLLTFATIWLLLVGVGMTGLRTYRTDACPYCGHSSTVRLDPDLVARWAGGELIQTVWPDMTADQRELLQTGYHPGCWQQAFGHLDDDDEQEDS